MEIQNASLSQPKPSQTETQNAGEALSSNFETFLKMLTTQLKNQDPLNPLESQDFAVQLATFSGVEQQVRTNELLENLKGSNLIQLAGLVGMEARTESSVNFRGTPVTLQLDAASGADRADLVVLNENGTEVYREATALGGGEFEWAGLNQDGTPLPYGRYDMRIEHFLNGESVGVLPVAHYQRIVEARQGPAGPEVVTEDGNVVPASEISAFRGGNLNSD